MTELKRGQSLWELPCQIRYAEGNRRLNLLADLLEQRVTPEKFNIEHWFNDDGESAVCKEGICGTSACAMGWACMFPEFNAMGVVWSDDFQPLYGNVPEGAEFPQVMDDGKTKAGWDTPYHAFGLTYEQSCHLFDGYYYHDNMERKHDEHIEVTIEQVVARIREFTSTPRLLP